MILNFFILLKIFYILTKGKNFLKDIGCREFDGESDGIKTFYLNQYIVNKKITI